MADEKWYDKRSDIYWIDPTTIRVLPGWNEREDFDLDPLLATLRENGITGLPPLRITRDKEGRIELRDGERRLRAVLQLIDEGVPVKTVPCVIDIDPVTKRRPSEADMLLRMYLANTGKAFTPLEEARTFRRFCLWNWTPEEIARRMGKSVSHVRATLALLDAAPEVVTALQNGTVSRSDAVAVVRESRRTETDQGALLAARQVAKREKKTAREKPPMIIEDVSTMLAQQIRQVCLSHSPVEVVNGLIEYLQGIDHDPDYVQALRDAQDIAARQGV